MKGGKRALSPWNMFVKKVYHEGKSKNSSYQFKNALRDASRRKSEMGSSSGTKKMGKSHSRHHRGTRKHHKGSRRRHH
jgi:hypothetical protein